jgi:hypothetical protein
MLSDKTEYELFVIMDTAKWAAYALGVYGVALLAYWI